MSQTEKQCPSGDHMVVFTEINRMRKGLLILVLSGQFESLKADKIIVLKFWESGARQGGAIGCSDRFVR